MSHKEISAWVMVLSAVVISAWVGLGLVNDGVAGTAQEGAVRMAWAIGYTVALNIVAVIIGVIVVSIVRREEVRDERADERDRMVSARAMGNGYFVLSIGIAGVLIAQALGIADVWVPYLLFGVSMLAGGIFAATQVVLYRIS